MTHIISASPCLGKTTIYQLNKERTFDRDFNESRSTKGMTPRQKGFFWYAASDLINVQADTDVFSYIFVTDELELLEWLKRPNLYTKAHDLTVILPDNSDAQYMAEYKKRIIERSGIEWFNRVMIPKLEALDDLMKKFQEKGFDVRLTHSNQPYIEDVFKFTDDIILPKK
ncbi:hypothetical protein [Lactococcus allomyrinae]|uniref:Guanylate kinase n=1 Tax=Lactococcus allomyrinae TaxID=2419773 RepID=A0A387BDS2_9LACT|nr:hypothetical protein [Lactococcus allomyrinae]AYG02023.1 hypothetical protein D7I46_12865 [Lactococcus allomyrinae]